MLRWKTPPPKVPEWCSVISAAGQAILLIDPQDVDLDYDNAQHIQQCIDWALGTEGDVILDFSQTPYLDTSGLGLTLSLQKQLPPRSRRLILVAPVDKTVHNILGLTRLESLFSRVDTYEEALEALAHPEPAA